MSTKELNIPKIYLINDTKGVEINIPAVIGVNTNGFRTMFDDIGMNSAAEHIINSSEFRVTEETKDMNFVIVKGSNFGFSELLDIDKLSRKIKTNAGLEKCSSEDAFWFRLFYQQGVQDKPMWIPVDPSDNKNLTNLFYLNRDEKSKRIDGLYQAKVMPEWDIVFKKGNK